MLERISADHRAADIAAVGIQHRDLDWANSVHEQIPAFKTQGLGCQCPGIDRDKSVGPEPVRRKMPPPLRRMFCS